MNKINRIVNLNYVVNSCTNGKITKTPRRFYGLPQCRIPLSKRKTFLKYYVPESVTKTTVPEKTTKKGTPINFQYPQSTSFGEHT